MPNAFKHLIPLPTPGLGDYSSAIPGRCTHPTLTSNDPSILTCSNGGHRAQSDRLRVLEAQVAGQRTGDVHVSTLDQNEKRQLEGHVLDRVFTDKASGQVHVQTGAY
jgi:hypothetical protein